MRIHFIDSENIPHMQVPPPSIDFTLPSPPLGQSQTTVADPPWMPHIKATSDELSLTSETTEQKGVSWSTFCQLHFFVFQSSLSSVMAMTKTRRKQKRELVRRAMAEAERKQSEKRDTFTLRATPAFLQAAYEPALFMAVGAAQQQQQAAVDEDGK
jgi:hypothetical protein